MSNSEIKPNPKKSQVRVISARGILAIDIMTVMFFLALIFVCLLTFNDHFRLGIEAWVHSPKH